MAAPRKRVTLAGHIDWKLVRPHVLGHLTLDEMATGLPAPFQEYMASWETQGKDLFMPVIDIPGRRSYIAKLQSGFEVELGGKIWDPFYNKWNEEVFMPIHGYRFETVNLGMAVLTNIHLFRLAMKYSKPKGS